MSQKKDIINSNIKYGHAISANSTNPDFHFHDHYEIYLFLSGNTTIFINEACYQPNPGDLFVYNSCDIHKSISQAEKEHERCCIHFSPNLISAYNTEQTDLLSCFHAEKKMIHLSSSDVEHMQSQIDEMVVAQKKLDYGCDILIINTLISILIKINVLFQTQKQSLPSNQNKTINLLLSYINQHIFEELDLEHLAKICCMDKYYLCNLFKKSTGNTIWQYIVTKRIALSKQFLSQGQSVCDACFNSGFNNYAHFSRTFKKIVGVTAREYQSSSIKYEHKR